MIDIELPLDDNTIRGLKAGDAVSITGRLYTARDAAHKLMVEIISSGRPLPFDIRGQTIYYTGPCPSGPGRVTGSAGPTTSGRMDVYTPMLLDAGLKGMIGKGKRSPQVKASMIKNNAVYFAVTGGAGALIARCIKECRDIAFSELGTEAIKELYVKDLPCIVATDSYGNDLYETEIKKYERSSGNG